MLTLAVISFLAPAMLAGLALVALPIAAHLLNRRAKRRVVFPSIVLLAATKASQSSLFRLRRWLLLLLRCAAVALIALAFAQPLWLSEAGQAASPDARGATVVVLDASASMGQVVDGVSAMAALRGAVGRALDAAVSRGDAVNVIVVDGPPRAVYPQPTRNADGLRAELAAVEPGAGRAELGAALAEAGEVLAGYDERRLVIASDLQATNWSELLQPGAAAALPEGTEVTILPAPGETPGNLAVLAPRSAPARGVAGRPVELVATLANLGPTDRVARLRLVVDGEPVGEAEALVEAWGRRDVAAPLTFDRLGDRRVVFEIAEDALASDNAAFHVLPVDERQTVVLIADDAPTQAGTAAFFVQRALSPRGDGSDPYAVRHVSAAAVTDAALRDAAAVFVTEVAAWGPALARTLAGYVRDGGGVALLAGESLPAALRALGEAEPGLAVAHGLTMRERARDPLQITRGAWDSGLLRAFDERSREALSLVPVYRAWGVDGVSPEAIPLLAFEDGGPALLARPVGGGRFVALTFGVDGASSDLAKHGGFVALTQSLASFLQPAGVFGAAATVGGPVRLSAAASRIGAAGFVVVGPGDNPIGSFDAAGDGRTVSVVLPRAERAGFFAMRRGDEALQTVAVNADPRESDLRRVDPAALQRALSEGGAAVEVAAAGGAADEAEARRPLWGWGFLGAMALLAVELTLLSHWRR